MSVFTAAFRPAAGRCNFPVTWNEREPNIFGAPSEAVDKSRGRAAHHPRLFAAGVGAIRLRRTRAKVRTERAEEYDALQSSIVVEETMA